MKRVRVQGDQRALAKKRRDDRLSQQRHRASKRSYVTDYENAAIVAAWEAGELTEGQAASALGRDRLGARLLREAVIGAGIDLASKLRGEGG